MKSIKKFEELEWGNWYNHDTYEFLEDVFVEFLHPTIQNVQPAKSNKVKSGYNMMVFYEILIPVSESATSVQKLKNVLERLEDCLEKTKSELPDIRHCIKMLNNSIKLIIWTK